MPNAHGTIASPARTPAGGARILLAEDDAGIAAEILGDLVDRGYRPTHVERGQDALEAGRSGAFDLIIMDRLLLGLNGLTVIERLRDENIVVRVLVLSALGAVDDKVRGLKAGGDDYLTKPFALAELAARVEALLRRPLETRDTIIQVGSLTLDLIERAAFRGGGRIDLLPREFRLLEYLMRRPGQVVTRSMLLEEVWHYRFVPQTNLVDVHIGKLRRKIEVAGEPPLIESIRGIGFQFRDFGSASRASD